MSASVAVEAVAPTPVSTTSVQALEVTVPLTELMVSLVAYLAYLGYRCVVIAVALAIAERRDPTRASIFASVVDICVHGRRQRTRSADDHHEQGQRRTLAGPENPDDTEDG